MAIVYRPTSSTSSTQMQRAGTSQSYSSGVVEQEGELTEFWEREQSALFEQWASSFDHYNQALSNPYFQYFYSGEDISVSIEGLSPKEPIVITSFAYNIQQQKQPVYGFWNYCVDDQTEALTKRGWVHGNDLTEDDTILSMHEGKLVWSSVLEIYRNPNYDGMMHRLIGSNSIDALVTPGHNFALTDGTLKKVEDLNKCDTLKVIGSALQQSDSPYSDQYVALSALRAAYNGKIVDNQLVIEVPHILKEEVMPLLKASEADFYDEYGPDNFTYKIQNVAHADRIDAEMIINMSTTQRQMLWDITAVTKGEDAVILATLLGIQSKLTPNKIQFRIEESEVQVSDLVMPGYQDSRKKLDNVPTEKYKGLVWCPKTEYGTFVCRRNGQTYVTGNTYSAMLRGTRIVTGAFSVATTGPATFTQLIAKAAAARSKARTSTAIRDLHSLRGLDEDEANIEKYWRRHLDNSLKANQQHLFSIHPPFNFIIQYGLQETSLVSNNPEVRAEEFKQRFNRNSVMAADFNERLVKNPSRQDDIKTLIENVELIGKQVQYDANGDPIMEIYSFVARDERLLSERVYAPLDTDIEEIGTNGVTYSD